MIRYASILQIYERIICCIFWLAFECSALQTLVKIVIFNVFNCKKLKKARNLQQNFARNMFFYVCIRTLVDCFIPQKMSFFYILTSVWRKIIVIYNFSQVKTCFYRKKVIFLGIKQLTSVLVQPLKNVCLANFAANFLLFFSFLAQKTLKMTILTSIGSAQHPNARQNIQQLSFRLEY